MSCETTINIEDGDDGVVVLEDEQAEPIIFEDEDLVLLDECA